DDKVVQSAAGQMWLDGRGFVAPSIAPDGRARYTAVVQWPPGYSIAYAAAIRAVRDPFLARYAIDLAAGASFLLARWRLTRAMHTPGAVRIVFLYWTAAVSAITRLPSSDAVALAAYSIALAALLGAARGSIVTWCAAGGFAAGMAGAVRFAYW